MPRMAVQRNRQNVESARGRASTICVPGERRGRGTTRGASTQLRVCFLGGAELWARPEQRTSGLRKASPRGTTWRRRGFLGRVLINPLSVSGARHQKRTSFGTVVRRPRVHHLRRRSRRTGSSRTSRSQRGGSPNILRITLSASASKHRPWLSKIRYGSDGGGTVKNER